MTTYTVYPVHTEGPDTMFWCVFNNDTNECEFKTENKHEAFEYRDNQRDNAIVTLIDKHATRTAHEIMEHIGMSNPFECDTFDAIMDKLVKEKRVDRSRCYPNVYISRDTKAIQDFILHTAYNL